jgi:hypothetical protein
MPTTHNGEGTVSSMNVVGKSGFLLEERWNWTCVSNYTQKISPWCAKDLNIRLEIIKLLEENLGINVYDFALS